MSAADSAAVDAAPTTVLNNGIQATTITVTVRDAGGNLLAGKNVTLDDGLGSLRDLDGHEPDERVRAGGLHGHRPAERDGRLLGDRRRRPGHRHRDGRLRLQRDSDFAHEHGHARERCGAHSQRDDAHYRPSAAGSFTLSSAVVDSAVWASGSATYPLVSQSGWTHALETVSTPAAGPYVSSAFT